MELAKRFVGLASLLVFLLSSVFAQTDKQRQFDFWIGAWDVNLRVQQKDKTWKDQHKSTAHIIVSNSWKPSVRLPISSRNKFTFAGAQTATWFEIVPKFMLSVRRKVVSSGKLLVNKDEVEGSWNLHASYFCSER